MIGCTIKSGRAYLSNLGNREAQTINDLLTFSVPGHEHMPLFQQGKWDGRKSFFDWRTKSIKRGLLEYLRRKSGIIIQVLESDCTCYTLPFTPVKIYKDGKVYDMRDFQIEGVKLMIDNLGGLAQIATNGGKTACISSLSAATRRMRQHAIILENRVDLLEQVQAEVEASIEGRIGSYTAKVKDIKDITILMVPTVAQAMKRVREGTGSSRDEDLVEYIRGVDIVLVDEVHHATAPSYQDIMNVNPKAQRFGFSGTIPEETKEITVINKKKVEEKVTVTDLDNLGLVEIFGDVMIRVPNSELIARGISAKPTINLIEYDISGLEGKAELFAGEIRNTCFKKAFVGTDSTGEAIVKNIFSVPTYTSKVKEYVMNYSVKHCQEFWDILKKLTIKHANVPTVILADWVDFSEKLAVWLDATVMHGKTKDRKQIITDFKTGKINRIVATSVLDEGLSIDQIRVVILATVGKSERQFLQRIGRGLRKKDEDNTLKVYDFVRHGHKYLLGPSKERIQMWKEEGFDVQFLDVEDI